MTGRPSRRRWRTRRPNPLVLVLVLVLGVPLTWGTSQSVFTANTNSSGSSIGTAADYYSGRLEQWGGGHELLPTLFDSDTTWTSVSGSGDHACGMKNNDTVWCWGTQTRLGIGITGTVAAPTQVTTPSATGWATVSAGALHTCGVRDDGSLYCWGRSTNGQLGLNNTTEYSTPQRVGVANNWTTVSAGDTHTCGLRGTTALYCWGSNSFGEVGNNASGSDVLSPASVSLPGGTTSWVSVQLGTNFTCAMPNGGKVYCWGNGATGRLGTGNTTSQDVPTQVTSPGSTGWSGLSAGHDFACALRTGVIWCWGNNSYGTFGNGNTTNNSTPQQNTGGSSWTNVTAGYQHTCGLKSGSPQTIWCWGDNSEGNLGTGFQSPDKELDPVQITVPFTPTTKIFDGSTTRISWFIGSDGKLYGWGRYFEKNPAPVAVDANTDWKSPAAGQRHYCGLRTGQLWCWGQNTDGRVGDSSTTRRTAPVRIGAASDWVAVTAGDRHTCGIRTATAYCWGSNATGKVGANTATAQYTAPQLVAGGYTDWTAIVAGTNHTCGIRSGQLWCWGLNANGQLGISSTSNAITPTRVGAASDWTAVAGGDSHSCGIRSTGGGTLYCWGDGTDGRLGLGNTTQFTTPQALTGAWSKITIGGGTTCGIKTAGTLWCWGDNALGQVGDGGTGAETSPYNTGPETTWKTISGAATSFCGTRDLRALYCWGEARSGTGMDDVTTRKTPTLNPNVLARPVVSGPSSRMYFAIP
jgi:alpha-tubulin suppressor-like RCC1 family protein